MPDKLQTLIDLAHPLRPAERRILARRNKLPPSAWAERERVLRRGAKAGPWRNAGNPVGALVMDLIAQPHVRVAVIAKGSQTGMSDAVYCVLGREVDYSTGADAALVVLADEKSVKKHSKKRIIPMLQDSKSLAEILSRNPDDTTLYSIQLATGAVIEIGWATSQVSVASEAYRWVILDEIGKYKSTVNIKEAEVRTATYEKCGKKIIKLGAPTDEGCPVDDALAECDVIFDVQVPCPGCGTYQVMSFAQFRWPGQQTIEGDTVADPRAIRRERSARYECAHCQAEWDDHARDHALQHANLQPRHQVDYPYAVGVHVPAWVTPFRSLSDCVAEWLEAQDRPEALRAWYNNWAGLSFSGVCEDDLTAAEILHARRYQWWPDGAAWIVPQRACLLAAAVDIQDNRLEAWLGAYGPGMECWDIEQRIFAGSPSNPEVWQQLESWLQQTWQHESGHRLPIHVGAVDTGGHHTQEAYRFLRRHLTRRIYGVKGASDPTAPLVRMSWPSKKQRRHVPLLIVGTVTAKNDIHAWYQVDQPGQPGYMHHHPQRDFSWFQQLASEKPIDQRDKYGRKKRFWVKKTASTRNEGLDMRVYAYAAIHYLNPNWHALAEQLQPVQGDQQTVTPVARRTVKPARKGFVQGWKS